MTTVRDTETVLPFVRRADLVIQELSIGGRVHWTVKDPVSLAFFQLREEEHFVFSRLSNGATVESIVSAFEKVYSPARLSLTRLDSYLRSLLAMGLIVNRSSDGADLLAHGDRVRRATWLASLGNPLVIRWRGFNPRLLIDSLYPVFRWCFTTTFVWTAIAVMVFAVAWMFVHHEEVVLRLPAMSAFISVHNMIWIAAAIGVAKVLHELGHALACKHFGGECREMGVMLLVFTPCLYCNVSDAWLMNNRWHRIAVSGAGIFVELCLAAVASLLWWFSEPGALNSICMNMMIVCSINTVMFNGNPLLKYDGYYVLTDLVGVPNLASQSKSRLLDVIVRSTCGVRFANPRALPGRGDLPLILFGAASFVYRWFVLVLILWTLHQLLRPTGMVAIAHAITASCIVTYAFASVRSSRAFWRKIRSLPTNKIRMALSLVIGYFAFMALMNLHIPRHVSAPVTVAPTDSAFVYVEEGGRIPPQAFERPVVGDRVERGDVLVVLENPDLDREILKLRERIEVLRLRVESMESSELRNGKPNENLPASKELLASLEEQMNSFRARHDKLTLRAPMSGIVLNDQWRNEMFVPHRLKGWVGSPLVSSSIGCTLERGTTYCLIGEPEQLSATLVVDESDIELVELGQLARVWLREQPGVVVTGEVQEISTAEIERAPASLVSKDDLKMIDDGGGRQRMANIAFNVRVPLDADGASIPVRSTGWAKIKVASVSIGDRIKRYLLSTFRLTY
ncbi:MAG: hypothetical protein AB8B91_21420 [Rubripirellula sp.]